MKKYISNILKKAEPYALPLILTILTGISYTVFLTLHHKPKPFKGVDWKNATVEQIQEQIQSGADVNAIAYKGMPPLAAAAKENENPEVVKALIKAGAGVNKLYRYYREDHTPFMIAVKYNNNPAVIEAMINAGANVNAKIIPMGTPLRAAVYNNKNPEVTETLIKAGADIRTSGLSLAMVTYKQDNFPAVKALVEAGAGVNAVGWNGDSPLMNAVEYGSVATVEILLKAGASVKDYNRHGRTPLMRAPYSDNPAIVEALLKAGASVNDHSENG